MIVVVVVVALLSASGSGVSIPLDVKLREGFRVPAPTGREAALIDDAKDGSLDNVDITTAALIASGVDDARIDAAKGQLQAATAPARQQAQTQKTAKKRGERLLKALHETVFTRYRETQSDVAAIVAAGEFNCLSSAVLFLIAAEGLVDRPRGMLSKTHAFARVDVDGAAVDVETTTKNGFAVDRSKLVTPAYLRTLGVGDGLSEAERLADLKAPDEVPLTGLIAALYSNRGVMLVRAGDVEGAAVAFDRATRIAQGSQRARVADWRAALLNNATQRLMDEGRLDDAKALLALALDGAVGKTRAALLQNLANVAVAQAERARKRGQLREARAFLDEALAVIASGGPNDRVVSVSVQQQIAAAAADLDGQLAATKGDEGRCATLSTPPERLRCFVAASQTLATAEKAGNGAQNIEGALSTARAAFAIDPKDPASSSVLYNALILSIRKADQERACERVEALSRDVTATRKSMKDAPAFPAAQVMGQCWWARADDALKTDRLDDAAGFFRRARVHLPADKGLSGNLREIELRRAHALALAGKCDEARPLVLGTGAAGAGNDDVMGAGKDDGRGAQMLELCANERAAKKAKTRDWEGAVVELRRGLRDAPDSKVLDDNLARMLHNVGVALLQQKRCDDALALLPELRKRQQTEVANDVVRICDGETR